MHGGAGRRKIPRRARLALDDTVFLEPLRATTVADLTEIDADGWDALRRDDQPFTGHAFLAALETTGCVTAGTGWTPQHLLLRDRRDTLVGAIPMYLKSHSWGEFVFDFSWAEAYSAHGLPYYPKLLAMCPFTPVTGTRLLAAGREPRLLATLADAIIGVATDNGLSSAHVLFTAADEQQALVDAGFLPRRECRFIWSNRDYDNFEAFLGELRASRRKQIKRERRRVGEQGIEVRTHRGCDLDAADWRQVYALTAGTFLMRGNRPYLSLGFLRQAAADAATGMVVNVARQKDQIVGAAILFRDQHTLYGRYWGAAAEYDCLHFETCYYRGIEYCIEHGLQRFDPGTQGSHKLRRGFAPTPTWSAHWIADRRFRNAIDSYLRVEGAEVDRYIRRSARHLPYRSGG